MLDFRVLQCLAVHQLGAETVANPDLTTPDELEGDNMRVRKLKSRLIRLGTHWDVYRKRYGRFSVFFIPRKRHRAACQTSLTTLKPNKQNGTRSQTNQNFKSSVAIDEVNASKV